MLFSPLYRARLSSALGHSRRLSYRPPTTRLAPSAHAANPAASSRISTFHTASSRGSKSASSTAGNATGDTNNRNGPSIIFSENQPADLPNRLSNLTTWTVTPNKMGIIRQFTFPTFAAAWRFMSLVADECRTKRHHPSWHNLYNQVTVEWTTHRPKGLSIKDIEMAEFCDRTADEIGLKD